MKWWKLLLWFKKSKMTRDDLSLILYPVGHQLWVTPVMTESIYHPDDNMAHIIWVILGTLYDINFDLSLKTTIQWKHAWIIHYRKSVTNFFYLPVPNQLVRKNLLKQTATYFGSVSVPSVSSQSPLFRIVAWFLLVNELGSGLLLCGLQLV